MMKEYKTTAILRMDKFKLPYNELMFIRKCTDLSNMFNPIIISTERGEIQYHTILPILLNYELQCNEE